MTINVFDPGIGRKLIVRGIHEKLSTREMRNKVKPGMHVIDIGANIGYYALMEAMLAGEEGRIYAIEPVPDNYYLIKCNVDFNGYGDRVRIFKTAIGASNRTGTMYLSKCSNRHSLFKLPGKTYTDEIQVPVITLDDFVDQNKIDLKKLGLIRMDVEGFEAEILQGMVNTLKACQRIILFIEWHPAKINSIPGCSFTDCLLLLKSFGAKFDLLFVRDNEKKAILRDKSIDEIMGSEKIINSFMESWLSIEN